MQGNGTNRPTRRQEYEEAESRWRADHHGVAEPPPPPGPASTRRRQRAHLRPATPDGVRHQGPRLADAPPPDQDDGPGLLVVAARDGRASRTEWLWQDHLEWSTVAMVQGEKGAGKSTWMRAIAADVTGGPRLPATGGQPRVVGNVLWFAGEEPLWTTVRPGLAAAGADLERCFLADALGEESAVLQLPNDCDRLTRAIQRHSAALVVIDPIFGFVGPEAELEGGSVPARRFIRHLMRVASLTGSLILLARNLTKDTSRGALAAGRGNGELGNAARSVLHLHSLPRTTGAYGLAVAVCNSGRPTPTITYRIADQGGSGVIHVDGTSQLSADELAAGDDGDLDRSQLEAAKELIRAMLPSGEIASPVVRARAEAAMITTRVLQLAAQRLGVRHRREGRRENTVVYWIAPEGGYK